MQIYQNGICIRNAEKADCQQLAAWWNDGKVMAHAGFPLGLNTTAEKTWEMIAGDTDDTRRRLVIEYYGQLIGETSYTNKGNNVAEIGIKICDADYQNRGLGRVILSLLLKKLFSRGFEKIILNTNLNNLRAQHVYEMLGFRKVKVNVEAWRDQVGVLQSFIDYELVPEDFIDHSAKGRFGLDSYVDERDIEMLEGDRYTFFVMNRVMRGKCELLLSDHRRLVLCYTGSPYPFWIWTPDDVTEEEMERAYQLVKDSSYADGRYRFNLKYEVAEYFMKRAEEDGVSFRISTNLFAYDCPQPKEPAEKAEGHLHRCEEGDEEELAEIMDLMHREVNMDIRSMEQYRREAAEDIAVGNVYFWQNEQRKNVACCKYSPNGKLASIGLVFTRPEERRRHYAENLVYEVTRIMESEGYLPMLYTDADYVASNACYEKIGYVLRGKLCEISPT